MSVTKDELVNYIKDWVNIDKEINILRQEMKQRRDKKKEITKLLVDTMKENDIDFFNINDGKIMYTANKVKAPLNKRHLQACLKKYFSDKEHSVADELAEFIMDSRNVNIKEDIKLKKTNQR